MQEMYERALTRTGEIVTNVRPEQLDDPTALPAWDVRRLMTHIIGGLRRFAAAVGGAKDAWERLPDTASAEILGADPATSYQVAAESLQSAWAEPGVMQRTVSIRAGDVPGQVAYGIHLTELVLHGWDLARATGQHISIDEETAERLLALGRQTVRPDMRSGNPFGPEIAVPDEAPVGDRLVAFFGREP